MVVDRVAVHRGVVEGRQVHRRDDVLADRQAQRLQQRLVVRRQRLDGLDDALDVLVDRAQPVGRHGRDGHGATLASEGATGLDPATGTVEVRPALDGDVGAEGPVAVDDELLGRPQRRARRRGTARRSRATSL